MIGIGSQLIASKVLNNSVCLVLCYLKNKQINSHKTTIGCFLMTITLKNPTLEPNSSSLVKVMETLRRLRSELFNPAKNQLFCD